MNRTYSGTIDLSAISGVVLVCLNGQYGYVCADNWDDREADVVCRSISSLYRAPYYGMFHHHALIVVMPIVTMVPDS